MLISKGIVPPPISLINDNQMVKAYYNAHEKDYEMLQSVITEKYRKVENANLNIGVQEEKEATDRETEKI